MIQHTVNLYLFSELSESAKNSAVKQAIAADWFGDSAQIECDSFVEGLRHYLEKIADIDSINYNIGFCKSDYFKIRFNSIQWKAKAKNGLDYAPDFIISFFDEVQTELKKLVYAHSYHPANWFEFTNIRAGGVYRFPAISTAIDDTIKRLERACYRNLSDIILDYSRDDNVHSILSDDGNRLYTVDGKFYCTAFEITHVGI